MTGVALIIAFVVAIVAMILLISKLKVHPFLAIMGISLVLAILAGIPLTRSPASSALASLAPSLPSVSSSSWARSSALCWKRPALH